MDTVIFTKCTHKLATCSISCLLCRCGGTERLNKMVAACTPMRRAGGGCIGHSKRILESGAHNLLHSTTQTSTRGQRSCICGPRRGAVGPGQLGRVRARIYRVARKKLYEKNEGSRVSGNALPLLRVLSQSHPVAAGVLRASLRLDRDSDGSSVDVCQGFPTLGCRDTSSLSLRLKGAAQRASRNHVTEHQKNKPLESPGHFQTELRWPAKRFSGLPLPFHITFQQHSLGF